MRLLLDTHILVWALITPGRLPRAAADLIRDMRSELLFSVVSLWEIAIKAEIRRPDFAVDPRLVRRTLLRNGYAELQVTAEHVFAIAGMPAIHKDPFDRLLIAQARSENATLVTNDKIVGRYPGSVLEV